jgi:hypothetical protein
MGVDKTPNLCYNKEKRKEMITMKLLLITDSIISLENVRRVEKKVTETKHTSYGEKYTIKHYSITIVYTDGSSECIECGKDAIGKQTCNEHWLNIFNKLSKG